MPDEYLPPNKILFIQNLPDETTKDVLEELFKIYPNLHDIRTIPGRKGIAFVEFSDEQSSTTAREALHNHKIDDDHKMKVRESAMMAGAGIKADRADSISSYSGDIRQAIE